MTSATSTTRTIIEGHLARVSRGMTGDLADFYAEDAVVEQPFMPGGQARIEGRASLRAHFDRARSMPLELRVVDLVVHETKDPEVVIAEYDYDGRVVPTGETFRIANVQIFRVCGGEIASSRDYHDHAAIAAALAAARRGANADAPADRRPDDD
jgi:ketosteroid isomerase-like protein